MCKSSQSKKDAHRGEKNISGVIEAREYVETLRKY